MGSIPAAFDRPARTAALIATEGEAVSAARTIAGLLDDSETQDPNATAGKPPLEHLSRSGLLGVSVPTEHGGIDVSNTVLADICAILAERSDTLGATAAAHFIALEEIRSRGTEAQRNTLFSAALTGARIARACPSEHDATRQDGLSLSSNGIEWHLDGTCYCSPATPQADWLLVPARNEAGVDVVFLVAARLANLRSVANGKIPPGRAFPLERVLFSNLPVTGDTLTVGTDRTGPDVPVALERLLEAAVQLGVARRCLHRAIERAGMEEGSDILQTGYPAAGVGSLAIRLAAATAAIESAGRAIDAAQIGSAQQHRVTARLAGTAASIIAFEAVRSARELSRHLAGGGHEPAYDIGYPPHITALLQEAGLQQLAATHMETEER